MSNAAYEAAHAGGVIDTATGIPKSREEMFKFYEFIRKQTRRRVSPPSTSPRTSHDPP